MHHSLLCQKWWVLFPYVPTKKKIKETNYKILGRLNTDKRIEVVLWESLSQTNILKALGRIDCL